MQSGNDFDREVTFEIKEFIGVISSYPTGWSKELNLVSWNGGSDKYDIRDWDPEHERMSRGVTLHEKEMRKLIELLKKRSRGKRDGYFDKKDNCSECSCCDDETVKPAESEDKTSLQ